MMPAPSKADAQKTAVDIAREVFPELPDDYLSHLVWERTGFPSFWPHTRFSVPTFIRMQLRAYKRAANKAKGKRLCDFCLRLAEKGRWTCKKCDTALHQHLIEG
jgi:hypothetical protein